MTHQRVGDNPGVIDHFTSKVGGIWVHSCLSNGYFEPDGSFVEREYQAAKAADPEQAAEILACTKPFGPGGAKQLGRAADQRPDWDDVKYQVMSRLVFAKFVDHPELAQELLGTGDCFLIEGNIWHDNIWGDCRCADPAHPECESPGLNWLGLILMSVRETLSQIYRFGAEDEAQQANSDIDMSDCTNPGHWRALRGADALKAAVDHYVNMGLLDSRSVPADVSLDYGRPLRPEEARAKLQQYGYLRL